MPDSLQTSMVTNAIGHCAGAIAFGLLLYLIFLSRSRTYRAERLVATAAALAFVWNAGSLVALTVPGWNDSAVDSIVALSFSALSFLPAVLLHIALPNLRGSWMTGYALSTAATVLHLLEIFRPDSRFHYAALVLITAGFGVLTGVSFIFGSRTPGTKQSAGRLATSMCLFLLAMSFVHFGTGHAREAWSGEIALHHAGIPLGMIILLQDYRVLLIDAFLRLILDGALALGIGYALFVLADYAHPLAANTNPGTTVLTLIAAAIALAIFVQLRTIVQGLVARWIFVQPDIGSLVDDIRRAASKANTEEEFLKTAAGRVAEAFSARNWDILQMAHGEAVLWVKPFPVSARDRWPTEWSGPEWVEAVVPLRLSESFSYLALGSRKSRRRYLSEDFETLDLLAAVLIEECGRMRNAEARRLVTQAELRALQAQINPHFFFNAMNTIYGVIDRENVMARKLILNLSDLFRFFFRPEQMLISLEDEMRTVRAYLEIEQARLGPKLAITMDVGTETRGVNVPSLCIQPLVENAVKHGAASRSQGGSVAVSVHRKGDSVQVEVINSGAFVPSDRARIGVGLANVRRRLQIWYGTDVTIESAADSTRVFFAIPSQPARSDN